MSTEELSLVAIGLSLVLIALLVEIEHKIIWKHYKQNYKKHKNKYIDMLVRPYAWVYRINVYIVWPLVILLGAYLIYENI